MGINSLSKLNDVTKYSNIMRYKCESSRIILNYSKMKSTLILLGCVYSALAVSTSIKEKLG